MAFTPIAMLASIVLAMGQLVTPSTAHARTVALFTVHQTPGSARAYQHPDAPRVTVNSAGWWRYSQRYSHLFGFTGTLTYNTRTRTIGLSCTSGGLAIWEVESALNHTDALVECSSLGGPLHPERRHVILGPGAGLSFEGWPLPHKRIDADDRIVVDVVVDSGGGTSAKTLGL